MHQKQPGDLPANLELLLETSKQTCPANSSSEAQTCTKSRSAKGARSSRHLKRTCFEKGKMHVQQGHHFASGRIKGEPSTPIYTSEKSGQKWLAPMTRKLQQVVYKSRRIGLKGKSSMCSGHMIENLRCQTVTEGSLLLPDWRGL